LHVVDGVGADLFSTGDGGYPEGCDVGLGDDVAYALFACYGVGFTGVVFYGEYFFFDVVDE